MLVAVLLASAATGCSSDVSRFGGLFNSSDDITTNSIQRPHITGLNGQVPVPRGDLAQGNAGRNDLTTRQQALNQPYPGNQSNVSYDPINTATSAGSGARMATTPVAVQRVELSDPTTSEPSNRETAMAQPFPASKPTTKILTEKTVADPLTTGTTTKGGWTTFNAPSVRLKPGESVAALSKRYGVPEKEILKANGLKSASAVVPGQQVVIPTFGKPRNAAKAASETANVADDTHIPVPGKEPQKEVAALPTTARDKAQASADLAKNKVPTGAGKPGDGDSASYEVKPGDSLAKIAKTAGVSVGELKAANGMQTASIRIGQKLKLPAGSAAAADPVKTASVPTKKVDGKPAVASETAAKQPEPYKAPIATQSVAEAEKKTEVTAAAPESTGIGKYRWPVRGAVVAAYGANVEGNRNDGIDISVPSGTAIKAAENGVVIYAGNGLKELGNTVLVRHDDGTVTVYGNADTLNVTRGQKIQRGQTLAASGMSGNAKRPQVHFEVRKDATPVNPMTFLE